MNDLAHDPLVTDSKWSSEPIPILFTVEGPDQDPIDVYMCSICRVLYEEDKGNVCAAKLARKLSL